MQIDLWGATPRSVSGRRGRPAPATAASGCLVVIAARGSRRQLVAQPQAAARGRCRLDQLELATCREPGEEPRPDGVDDASDCEAQLVDQVFGEKRLGERDA